MTEERKGEWNLIGASFLWSFFPILTILSIQQIPPITAAGISTLFAAVFFMAWVSVRSEWHLLRNSVWKQILLSTLLIGVLFFGILFIGISHTTAGNTAILLLSQVFFTFLILNVFLSLERNTTLQYIGAFLMVVGAVIVLLPRGGVSVDFGALLIIVATVFPPMGNWFAKQALQEVSPHFLMMVRSTIAGFFLLALGFLIETVTFSFGFETILFIAINGLVLLGFSKILWLEAIRRITVAKAVSMGAIEPVLTIFFAFIILSEIPTMSQLIGIVPVLLGVYLITLPQKDTVTAS